MANNISLETASKVSPPWIEFHHEVEKLFEKDPQVSVTYDDVNKLLKIFVNDATKAEAIAKLIPESVEFGNVVVSVEVVPPNVDDWSVKDLYKKAFEGNGAVDKILTVDGGIWGEVNFVMFKKEVVQFPNDEMSHPDGIKSMLYEDIAREVFSGDKAGIFFCTNSED